MRFYRVLICGTHVLPQRTSSWMLSKPRILGFFIPFEPQSSELSLILLHQVLICETYVLPQLRQFWTDIQTELANKDPYKTSIGGMQLQLSELQESDSEARKIRVKDLDSYKKSDRVLHHQQLPFVPEII